MTIIIAILIYCLLIVIKRIFQPRVIKRMHEFDLEVNTWFVVICLVYVGYMMIVKDYTLSQLRRFSFC